MFRVVAEGDCKPRRDRAFDEARNCINTFVWVEIPAIPASASNGNSFGQMLPTATGGSATASTDGLPNAASKDPADTVPQRLVQQWNDNVRGIAYWLVKEDSDSFNAEALRLPCENWFSLTS